MTSYGGTVPKSALHFLSFELRRLAAAQDPTEGTVGPVIGDRNFWSPRLREQLAQRGIQLLAGPG